MAPAEVLSAYAYNPGGVGNVTTFTFSGVTPDEEYDLYAIFNGDSAARGNVQYRRVVPDGQGSHRRSPL